MIIIQVKNAGSIEQALKQYKFKVYRTKQLEKLRERQEFTKKSVKTPIPGPISNTWVTPIWPSTASAIRAAMLRSIKKC